MAKIGEVGVGPDGAARDGAGVPAFTASRLRFFQAIELIIAGTAYVYFALGLDPFARKPRGLVDIAIWTVLFGAFVLYPLLLEARLVRRGRARAYLAGRFILCAITVIYVGIGFVPTFLFFIVVGEAITFDRRFGWRVGAAAALVLFGTLFLFVGTSRPEAYLSLLPWLIGLFFVANLTALMVREAEARTRSDQLLAELSAAHRQLQERTEQVRELATTQERNRLAREIHDSLGHYLTVINVQLESALALRGRDAARADRAVGEAKRLASEALADVRRSVAALRPTALDDSSIGTAIARQVADFRAHSGLAVRLTIEGDEAQCPQAAALALYRAVQEGLNNVRKHAAATEASVALRFGPTMVELLVCDNGRGPTPEVGQVPSAGGGFGLTGLRERMALLGGGVDIAPVVGGGTVLRVSIPVESAVGSRRSAVAGR